MNAPICSCIPPLQAPPGDGVPRHARGMDGWMDGWMEEEEVVLGCLGTGGAKHCTAQDHLPLAAPIYPISS